jgi:Rrf2 family protein
MSHIFNLTEGASIALHSMVIIARNDSQRTTNVNELAVKTGSSKYHTSKIMQKLVKDGYLSSTRGPAGGFILAKRPEEITLQQIYESVEGKIEVSTCPVNRSACPFGGCIFDDITVKMTNEFVNYISTRTLAHYVGNKRYEWESESLRKLK